MFIEIGGMLEKRIGDRAFQALKNNAHIEAIFIEHGRSSDLFEHKQFGYFGEATILSIIIQAQHKEKIFQKLYKLCELDTAHNGIIYINKPVATISMDKTTD